VSPRDEADGADDSDDEPPFDVVQAVSDFIETVIDEVDPDRSEPDRSQPADE
jgi:hypothetical protein